MNYFFRVLIVIFYLFGPLHAMEQMEISDTKSEFIPTPRNLVSSNLDQLVLDGIRHIRNEGELFEARAGSGQQAYDVSYTLSNPLNRVHTIRKTPAIRYFCRELLAYFKGSLKVDEGLGQAAPMWKTLADKNGCISSNYGYYVFHEKLANPDIKSQYDWVVANLLKSLDSRKAIININQPQHKDLESKDFPCTIAMQFFVRNNHLCCVVSSRSTDIYTGLPYDMGFFSFVTELVYKDLMQKLPAEKSKNLKLGYTTMKTNFTQIYDKTRTQALKLADSQVEPIVYHTDMPEITDAEETLKDIYNQTAHSAVMKWIYKHADYKP